MRVEYDYIKRPAALANTPLEEPLVPLEHRHVIADLALAYLFMDKNDSRAAQVLQLAQAGLVTMAGENRARLSTIGFQPPFQLQPQAPQG